MTHCGPQHNKLFVLSQVLSLLFMKSDVLELEDKEK